MFIGCILKWCYLYFPESHQRKGDRSISSGKRRSWYERRKEGSSRIKLAMGNKQKLYCVLLTCIACVVISTASNLDEVTVPNVVDSEEEKSVEKGNRTDIVSTAGYEDYPDWCPSNVDCQKLSGDCLNCTFDEECVYGSSVEVTCSPQAGIVCDGPQSWRKTVTCRYCYQTEDYEQTCTASTKCRVVSAPKQRYMANCSVKHDVLCLGSRRFHRRLPCNWTSGKRWSVALILSITLGGFGVDRFYLGLWKEGIGKLFSFGGLGVWTLVDVILIACGYVGPANGSLYIW